MTAPVSMPDVLPQLAHDVGRMLKRLVQDPPPDGDTDPDAYSWHALLILCLPELHDGLRAAETLAALDRAHQPAGAMGLCARCHVRPPCSVQQVIHPETDP